MLFYTESAAHIADHLGMEKGSFALRKFSDGEIYCRVEEDVRRKPVWVLASTQPPADSVLQLAFLLDSLRRRGAKTSLMMLYFAYARQDRIVKEGEALSSKVICDLLGSFSVEKTFVVHMHSPRIRQFLDYEDIMPTELFSSILSKMDVVVAPDRGAFELAKSVSKRHGLPLAYMEKLRPEVEKVEISRLVGDVKGRRAVIVDDMISTGGTVIKAGRELMDAGASEVNVVATHGVFSDDAVAKLERSEIKSVHVTNSIKPTHSSKIIKTTDISGLVETVMMKRRVPKEYSAKLGA